MNINARVKLWGSTIGVVSWINDRRIGVFQYVPEFLSSNIQVAPLTMPLSETPYSFPGLSSDSFKGLPGLLADSLPDRFGNAVIDTWLAEQGRLEEDFNPVERLCYIGHRGMGALEYEPAIKCISQRTSLLDIDQLVNLANQILNERQKLIGSLTGENDQKAIEDIIRVGSSAGGARAKAVLAWNPVSGKFKSGQLKLPQGFEHWIMKFDGISENSDNPPSSAKGYGKIEFAYHLMAVNAGIDMTECRIYPENGRTHFMTRRFDRTTESGKLHVQTLGAMAHFDYMLPASYSYEQALQVIRRLQLPQRDLEQVVLRAIFNVVGRNCDDHVKNIAFIMNRKGEWSLAPAYDLTYAWNPAGVWTSQHQMSINGKRENIHREDLIALAEKADLKKEKANILIDKVMDTFSRWQYFAGEADIDDYKMAKIRANLILRL
ncbi:MAG: type II toxin-antitoxin system HipA family toxin [Candidatus Cloacimonetes bacterium]|nr:type II toxin-antitoxin system HipA family toxin [Candidatus Cloacimonadota bacterium]